VVRFLRNAIVVKVAGDSSELLQISSDERSRVSRVAELFTEEDLTRFLNIMLRTHGELGYKQEQRLHLELGILKMVHAQRLLPIEELLSQGTAGGITGRPAAVPQALPKPVTPKEPDRSVARPSPFAADSARKGTTPRQEISAPAPNVRPFSSGYATNAVIMGSAAPAGAAASMAEYSPEPAVAEPGGEAAPETSRQPEIESGTAGKIVEADELRSATIVALENAGHRMLATMLDGGQWSFAGNELLVKVAALPAVIEMAMGAEPKKLASAAASEAAGRPVKIRVVSGGTAPTAQSARTSQGGETASRPKGTGRGRALQDPVVRHMQEKFGAEIRTIIDHRDKR
jgi:DNA polymerase-3 subunit gamma/tau